MIFPIMNKAHVILIICFFLIIFNRLDFSEFRKLDAIPKRFLYAHVKVDSDMAVYSSFSSFLSLFRIFPLFYIILLKYELISHILESLVHYVFLNIRTRLFHHLWNVNMDNLLWWINLGISHVYTSFMIILRAS